MTPPARITGRDLIVTLCLILLLGILGWSFLSDILQHRTQPELTAADSALSVGNTAKATALFDKAVKRRSDVPDLYIAVCGECEKYEQWGLMAEYAQRGVQECKYAPNSKRAQLYLLLASALSETEPHPQLHALDAATTAQQIDPQNIDALNTLGYILADNDRDLENAKELLTQALRATERKPDAPEKQAQLAVIEDSYGWLLFKQGQNQQAIDVLLQALDDMPEEAESPGAMKTMYYHLGAAYQKAGRTEEARQALLIALQYDSNYSPAKEELAALPPPPPSAPANVPTPASANPPATGTQPAALGGSPPSARVHMAQNPQPPF